MTRATVSDLPHRLRSSVAAVFAAAVLNVAATSATAQDTTGVGAISGVVANAACRPAEGVRVCALDTAACATSDAQGAFRIGELRSGAYRLEILPREGLPFTSDPVDVRAGLDGIIEITLPAVANFEQAITVTAPAFRAPEAVKTSGFLVEPRAVLKSAAGGRPLNLFLGVQNVTNRRNFANYSWNRRTNTQQLGEQQGIFPIVGLDWRF